MSNKTTQDVLTHHLTAFGNNDLEEILKDYTEESVLFTPHGQLQGIEAIKEFFAAYFIAVPNGSSFEMKQLTVKDNLAYIAWSSDSNKAQIPMGTDTFFLEDGKIKYHTVAEYRINK